MTIQQNRPFVAAQPIALEEAEAILERFPAIEEYEARQIAAFIQNSSSLDVALLSSNKPAWENVERLRSDRPELFRTTAKGWAIFAAIAVITVAIIWGLWAIAPQ